MPAWSAASEKVGQESVVSLARVGSGLLDFELPAGSVIEPQWSGGDARNSRSYPRLPGG